MEINHIENTSPYSKENALFNLYKLGTLSAAILSILIGIVLFYYHMDDGRYFKDVSATTVSLILLATNIGFAIIALFLFKKGVSEVADYFSSVKYLFLIPSACAVVISIVLLTQSPFNTTLLASSVMALLSAAYTACLSFSKSKVLKVALGYFHVFFLIAILASLSLDTKVELNAPMKMFTQFTAMAAILCTLSDIRIMLKKESVGAYTFSNICLLILSLFTGIGALFEVIPNFNSYSLAFVAFPLYLLSLAIPSAARFFCAVLRVKAHADKVEDRKND